MQMKRTTVLNVLSYPFSMVWIGGLVTFANQNDYDLHGLMNPVLIRELPIFAWFASNLKYLHDFY